MNDQRIAEITDQYEKAFGDAPDCVIRAPGRVNLIGEHTDYNEGFVFPVAIDREMLIAAGRRSDRTIEAYSGEYDQKETFSLDDIKKSTTGPWSDYLRGTLSVLQESAYKLQGMNLALSGNVPQGAGLSSSAAYEVAVATLCNQFFGLGISGKDIALLAQRAENKFIGVQCGIMDQFISALGKQDSALQIDCRDLSYKAVPLNFDKAGIAIVITNSGVRRGLVDSEYNARRTECERGVHLMSELLGRQCKSLRDISVAEFDRFKSKLPAVTAKRCGHVLTENARVLDAVQALEAQNYEKFGKLMNESHQSLRDDFEVSCKELDVLVDLTQQHTGILGARMTGAGFGGCTVAIMKLDSVRSFQSTVIPAYEKQTGRKAEVYVCHAVAGAEPVKPAVVA